MVRVEPEAWEPKWGQSEGTKGERRVRKGLRKQGAGGCMKNRQVCTFDAPRTITGA